jgi:hypothetical protein
VADDRTGELRQPDSFRAGGDDTKRAAGSALFMGNFVQSGATLSMIEATKLSILRETSATRLQATSFVDDRQSGSHQIHFVGPHPETLLTKFQNFLTEGDR